MRYLMLVVCAILIGAILYVNKAPKTPAADMNVSRLPNGDYRVTYRGPKSVYAKKRPSEKPVIPYPVEKGKL